MPPVVATIYFGCILGIFPFPVIDKPAEHFNSFRFRDPNLNLHLPLVLGRGVVTQRYINVTSRFKTRFLGPFQGSGFHGIRKKPTTGMLGQKEVTVPTQKVTYNTKILNLSKICVFSSKTHGQNQDLIRCVSILCFLLIRQTYCSMIKSKKHI